RPTTCASPSSPMSSTRSPPSATSSRRRGSMLPRRSRARASARVGREEPVDDEVEIALAVALGVAPDALLAEARALRDGPAARVVHGGADLDPVQPPRAERMVDERAHGLRHRAPPLVVGGKPVADARRTVQPADAV